MELTEMTPEEVNLILRHLRDQGYPARILTWEPLLIGIDLPELERPVYTGNSLVIPEKS